MIAVQRYVSTSVIRVAKQCGIVLDSSLIQQLQVAGKHKRILPPIYELICNLNGEYPRQPQSYLRVR